MSLATGSFFGPYEILSRLGEGGMGEVYRASDTKLNRDVALKLLLPDVAADPDRLARFRREAQILASLNHQNIGHLYGIEEGLVGQVGLVGVGSGPCLVMELVEGPTLADVIAKGPVPLVDALQIAAQIARALEAAHDRGIVHRDLKPSNVKVREDGTVKVLDFGLAKALDQGSGIGDQGSARASLSPTITMPTMAGVIIGTAAYMAPEQAAGKPADRRSDLWAFGVVLMEMLTGRQVFTGETVSHILAAVLTATPDWATLPVATPEPVRRLLRRCLERDKRKRLESAADAQLELDEALNAPAASSALVAAARRPSARTAWALAAVSTAIAVAVGGYAIVRRAPAAPRAGAPIRFTIAPPPDALLSSAAANDAAPALSPDGTMIVFGATSGSVMSDRAGARLWIRRLDSLDSKPLDGTDGAAWPFWSPDSRIIGFIAPRGDGGARLKTIDVDSGQIKTICESDVSPRGASWNEKGVIIFAAGPRIMRVAATGGDPSLLRQADASQSELVMRWPVFLPDGVHYLYSAQVAGKRTNRLSVASLDDDKAVFLREVDVNAAFANGYILFAQGNGRLAAQPFDPTRLTLTGGPRVIASDFARSALTMLHSHFSVSRGGVLEYQPASIPQTELVILDRNGNTQRTIADDGHTYLDAAISPDRRFIAFDRYDRATGDPKVWIFDLERNTAVPLTPGIVDDAFPAWSPDSSAVVFSAAAKDAWGLYRRRRGTSAAPELLASMPNMVTYPNDLSPDGRTLAYMTTNVGVGGWDVLGIDLPTGKASPLADGPRDQHHARYSPDGRWLAYGSRESGQFEVYVESTGSDKARSVVSVGGGDVPRWRSDGRELYYVRDETVFAVPVLDGAPLRFGAPVKLFTKEGLGRYPAPTPNGTHFDASPDGQWFVADVIKKPNGQSPINVIVNWPSMLKQ